MKIEALTPLRVKRPAGDLLLLPGKPFEFQDQEGRRLLERAAGKVREIEDSIRIGMIVEWDSPLFGLLHGVALEVTAHGVRVHHPLTEQEVPIPRTWLKVTDLYGRKESGR